MFVLFLFTILFFFYQMRLILKSSSVYSIKYCLPHNSERRFKISKSSGRQSYCGSSPGVMCVQVRTGQVAPGSLEQVYLALERKGKGLFFFVFLKCTNTGIFLILVQVGVGFLSDRETKYFK